MMYVLNQRQFGFRHKHSTTHALIEVIEGITMALDNNDIAMGVYLDLKKAFDTVNHEILLAKLYNYGIRGNTHQWLKSYLTNRQQFVKVNGTVSQCKYVNTGVPQGSVLGPLLFILYINDITNCASKNCKIMLYADDTNVLLIGDSMNNLKCQMEDTMNKLYT